MDYAVAHLPLPVRFRPLTPMTDNELIQFCVVNDPLKIEREPNGEILVMTPAGVRTGIRNTNLIIELGIWARADGRGHVVQSNTGFTLPDGSMRSPDAAWFTTSRLDALSAEDQERFSPLCPEFVLELRSASDRMSDLEDKMLQWMSNGVKLAWLIDPKQRLVIVYRAGIAPERLQEPSVLHGDGPLSGFELTMANVWA